MGTTIIKTVKNRDELSIKFEDEKQTIFYQSDLFAQGFPIFEELRNQEKLCDVILKVDDRSFGAHRIVLVASIPYFRGMFLNDMIESTQKEITLKKLDPTALENLINFAYTGKIVLTSENVQNVMTGASFFQLQKVKDACARFLKKQFHPQNILGIRQFAELLSCQVLVQDADKYIQRYFSKVSQADEFSNLQLNNLKHLISKDELDVVSEEEVFEAVMRWVKFNKDERSKDLPELLALVRLPLLSPSYLTDYVAKEESIRSSHPCRDLLDEAKDYHLMPERRFLIEGFRCRPRYHFTKGHIFAIGGLTNFGDSLSTVEVFDPTTETWRSSQAMTTLRSRVGIAVLENKLYAFGGYNGCERLSTVEVYYPKLKMWKIVSSMHCKRSAVGTTNLDDFLYVCGGYDGVTSLNTVERYCPETDTWKMINPMNKHRSAGGVVAFQGYVYALGGHDGLSIFDSVERYDPKTATWTDCKSMLTRRCRLGVATLNGKLYVCGGYDGSVFLKTVEVYDPIGDTWKHVAPMNIMRSRAALVANMGKLWAIGGYDGISNLATVEVYNPETDTWSFSSPMSAHEGGVGVGVLSID